MFIYNTTFFLEESVLSEWRGWLDRTYVPLLIGAEGFFDIRMARVLSAGADEAVSISVQCSIGSLSLLEQWRTGNELSVATELRQLFGTKVLSFSTILEVLT
jgi:hypothetical protein